MDAPEFNKKVNISLSFLIGLIISAFTLGGTVSKILAQEKEIQEMKEYLEGEVSGLRSDWERRYQDNIKPRLEKLEEKHNK